MPENCDYLVRGEKGRTECGQPATHRYWTAARRWFYVCPEHSAQVYRDTRKKIDPTPLVKTIMAEKPEYSAPVMTISASAPPPVATLLAKAGKSISEQIRDWRESQGEGDKP